MDFDADRIYYSHQNLQQENAGGGAGNAASNDNGRLDEEEDRAVDTDALRRHYREFLSECHAPLL